MVSQWALYLVAQNEVVDCLGGRQKEYKYHLDEHCFPAAHIIEGFFLWEP